MIPGYLFVKLDLTNMFFDRLFGRILRTRNVSGFLLCDSVPVRIPCGIIDDIRAREAEGAFCKEQPPHPDGVVEEENSQAAADTEEAASLPDESRPEAVLKKKRSAPKAKKVIPLVAPANLEIDARVAVGEKAMIRVGQFTGRIFTVKQIVGAMAILDAEMFGKAFPLPVPLDHLQYHATANRACQTSQVAVNA